MRGRLPGTLSCHIHGGDDEVLFEDIKNGDLSGWAHKKGARKVRKSAEQAFFDGLDWIWIDTLCIDKSSSAELSEAINSMFKWYNCSALCYAYLFDVRGKKGSSIKGCRWLSRGWTLQELIAPESVHFYDEHWRFIGTRNDLAGEIESITGIDHVLLYNYDDENEGKSDSSFRPTPSRPKTAVQDILASLSVASRMFWASSRQTTRSEDAAYCLMGLFNVNMPLLYGEGKKSFARLQDEIIKVSTDTSILAFTASTRRLRSVLVSD
ncbi:hypothetical protein PG997_005038 [Apiospora hydei]|uniref:Heterokaryon incompatibility domain-containing protein n=1 Tax=Apiospora hydei TaxID=1337664 RepID=A0ABR1X3Z5_9PEZI